MDAVDLIQAELDEGYAELAAELGRECLWFRPMTANDPLHDRNAMGTLRVYVSPVETFKPKVGKVYGDPQVYGAFEQTDFLPGDYLVRDWDDPAKKLTYFINHRADLTPVGLIECNHVVSIYRPAAQEAVEVGPDEDDDYYEGNLLNGGEGQCLAANWPCSILEGTKGERPVLNLPNDPPKTPWFDILLPEIPGLKIRPGDQITDQDGTRYTISSPERTAAGWRLTAGVAEA